jgi:hypothetical protein
LRSNDSLEIAGRRSRDDIGRARGPGAGSRRAAASRRQTAPAGRAHRNGSVTEITKISNRGHSLTIDSGWREVAQTALDFVKRFV